MAVDDGTRSGWVGIGNAMDVDFIVGIDHGQLAEFSLRVDTCKVPSVALKYCNKRNRAWARKFPALAGRS